MWSFVADSFSDYANKISGRTRMPKLNRKQLFGFALSHPELNVQQAIVAYLEKLRTRAGTLGALYAMTLAELDCLLPSILDMAFKGEL